MASAFLLLLCVFASAYGSHSKELFKDSPHVEHLTEAEFEKKVLKSDKTWLVEFYDKNEKSAASVPEIEKAARILVGIAKIAVVNAAEEKNLAHNYDAKETPSILVFGVDKQKPTLYKDELDAAKLIKKVGAQVKALVRSREEKEPNPKKDVIKLTADNFSKKVLESDGIWFVKYYDPNCGHSKAFAPEYAKAASSLKGAINVGAVNMDVEVYDKMGEPYNIEKVPWVKIFGVNKKIPSDFEGSRSATILIDRALEEMEAVVRTRLLKEKEDNDLYKGTDSGEEDEKAKDAEKEEEKVTKIGKKQKKEVEKEVDEEQEEKEKEKVKESKKIDEKKEKKEKKEKDPESDKDKEKAKKKKECPHKKDKKEDKKESKDEL